MPNLWTPERIQSLRYRLQIPNQTALAKRLGTSQAVVSAWEVGKNKPSPKYAYSLDALDSTKREPPADSALRTAAGDLAAAAVAFVVAFRTALRGASEVPTE